MKSDDILSISRVSNGWVIRTGSSIIVDDFTHVYMTPEELSKHVLSWAKRVLEDK